MHPKKSSPITGFESFHVSLQSDNLPLLEIKTELIGRRRKAATKALVDSGATGNFINQDYAIRLNMRLKSLANKIPFAGANKNKSYVTHYTEVNMKTEDS